MSLPATTQIPTLSRALGARAVHVHVVPRPTSVAQTSDILSVLRRSGAIEYFKWLAHDGSQRANTLLAIFRDANSVQDAIRRSPVLVPVLLDGYDYVPGHGPGGLRDGVGRRYGARKWVVDGDGKGSTDGGRKGATVTGGEGEDGVADEEPKFTMTINKSTWPHQDAVRLNPFHGPFAVDRKSVVQGHLERRVPLVGISDVKPRKEGVPSRILTGMMAREKATRLQPLKEMYEGALRKGSPTKEPYHD